MERHIMYEREKRTPLELASDPKEFANTYAELCGVIPIDDLVDLYRKAFPELPMDYETMRKAAAGRRHPGTVSARPGRIRTSRRFSTSVSAARTGQGETTCDSTSPITRTGLCSAPRP